MTHKTGKRLLVASPLVLAVALLAPRLFGRDAYWAGRETALWILGGVWFCVCVGAAWSWGRD